MRLAGEAVALAFGMHHSSVMIGQARGEAVLCASGQRAGLNGRCAIPDNDEPTAQYLFVVGTTADRMSRPMASWPAKASCQLAEGTAAAAAATKLALLVRLLEYLKLLRDT